MSIFDDVSPEGSSDRKQDVYTEQHEATCLRPAVQCTCISRTLPPTRFPRDERRHRQHTPGSVAEDAQWIQLHRCIREVQRWRTLSGWQRTSVQPQSLVKEDVTNPVGQVWLEFLQLHVHSSSSQHLVFFTDSWRWAGHSGGAWRVHASLLHTEAEKYMMKCILTCRCLCVQQKEAELRHRGEYQPTTLVNGLTLAGVLQHHSLTVLTARRFRQVTARKITHWSHKEVRVSNIYICESQFTQVWGVADRWNRNVKINTISFWLTNILNYCAEENS